ncbi:MAG: FmdB family zinc ribbon protein [Terriglobia bacterium]
MPIFEYQCRDCGARFEQLVPSHKVENAEVACRQCESARVDRLLSVFMVSGGSRAVTEPGPCPCGAPRRGMCGG